MKIRHFRSSFLVAVSLAFIATFLVPSEASASDVKECEINSPINVDHAHVGFGRDSDVVASVGSLKILALAVDFSDAPVVKVPTDAIAGIVNLKTVTSFYSYVSNDIFKPQFIIHPTTVRMPMASSTYGGQVDTDAFAEGLWNSQKMVYDAVKTIENEVVLTDYSAVMVFVSTGSSLSGYVGQTTIQDRFFFRFASGEVHNFSLIGQGIARQGLDYAARVVIHEVGHLLGLPDLYSYD